jgi:hypothetical protein
MAAIVMTGGGVTGKTGTEGRGVPAPDGCWPPVAVEPQPAISRIALTRKQHLGQ